MSNFKTYTSIIFAPSCETGPAQISVRMSKKEFFDCSFKLLRQGDSHAF